MMQNYQMKSTSLQSAVVEDKVIASTSMTRLVLRATIVNNPKNPVAGVRILFVHQRKKPDESWEDIHSKKLSSLKAGEEVNLTLDSDTTLNLYHQLVNLYAISSNGGVRLGDTMLVVGRENEIIKTDSKSRARIIRSLLKKNYPEEFWGALIESRPDIATRLSYAKIHTEREESLRVFHQHLGLNDNEDWWQSFFEKNTWIFGYGLNYKILKPIQSQPRYGGTTLKGKGLQKGDFLQRTEAEVRFTVLVEIKKPTSLLLGKIQYRNGAWQLSEDLTGGVSQMLANCRQWEISGAQTEENRENLIRENIFTVQPKGILVIGHTNQLGQIEKRNTFELFRRNTTNPEILTFDELYERAKFILERSSNSNLTDDEVPF